MTESKKITEPRKDMICWLDACRIPTTTIFGICNMLKTDDEVKELIRFSLEIPKETYQNNPDEAEEQILAKALLITREENE